MTEKTTKQILTEARDLISNPDKWTKHEYARNANGRKTEPLDINAVCWCSLGAMRKVADAATDWRIEGPRVVLKRVVGASVHSFNDSHTHAEVIEAFNKAIEAADNEA